MIIPAAVFSGFRGGRDMSTVAQKMMYRDGRVDGTDSVGIAGDIDVRCSVHLSNRSHPRISRMHRTEPNTASSRSFEATSAELFTSDPNGRVRIAGLDRCIQELRTCYAAEKCTMIQVPLPRDHNLITR